MGVEGEVIIANELIIDGHSESKENAMTRYHHVRSIIVVASLVLVSWHWISIGAAFAIGEGAQANRYAEWCRQQGGTVTNQGGLGCVPGGSGGYSGGGFSGGGFSSREQAMLGMAGAFGSLLGNAIRESAEANARQAEMDRMQRAWEMDEERKRLEEERQKAQAERELRHRDLMSKLKGSLGRTEMGMKQIGGSTLQLKSGSALFGQPANPTGTLQQEVPVATGIPDPTEPATVQGRPVNSGLVQATEKAWDDYLAAVQRKNQAEAKLKQAEAEHRMIEQLRHEAEKKLQEQRKRVSTIPLSQPEEKKVEDDKLAEAEKLLNDAIKLDEDATKDLAGAKKDAEGAKATLAEAEKKKQQAMKLEKE